MTLAWIDRCFNIFAANHLALRKMVGQKNQKACFQEFNAEFGKAYNSMMNAVGVDSGEMPTVSMASSLDSFSSLDSTTEAIVQQGLTWIFLIRPNLFLFLLAIQKGTSVVRKTFADAQTNTGKYFSVSGDK